MRLLILTLLFFFTVANCFAIEPTSLPDLENKKVSFDQFKGKALVINYIASWCGPCLCDTKKINSFYKKLNKDKFKMFTIVRSDAGLKEVRIALKRSPFEMTVLFDENSLFYKNFKINSYPTTLLFNEKHQLIKTIREKFDWASYKTFDEILKK